MLLAVAAMGTYSAMSVAAGQPGTLLYAGTAGGRKNTMFLVSQFQSGSCTTLPFKELEDKSELIDSFADSHKISRKDLSIAGFKGSYWLGYYDPGEQKYSIYKF